MNVKQTIVNIINKIKSLGLHYWIEIGVYALFIILLAFIPKIGFINIGSATITILCFPVLVAAIRRGPFAGALIGFIYGLTTFLIATISKYGGNIYIPVGFEYVYTNIIVAVIPGMILGIMTAHLFKGFKNVIKQMWYCVPLTTLVSMILNVVITAIFAFIFNSKTLEELYGKNWIQGMYFARNYLWNILEIFLTVIISVVVLYLIDILTRKKAIIDDEKGEENEQEKQHL